MPRTWFREIKLDNFNDYTDMEDYDPYIDYLSFRISSKSKNGLIKNIEKSCWNEYHRQIIYDDTYNEDDMFKFNITIISCGQNVNESFSIRKNILSSLTNNRELIRSLIY